MKKILEYHGGKKGELYNSRKMFSYFWAPCTHKESFLPRLLGSLLPPPRWHGGPLILALVYAGDTEKKEMSRCLLEIRVFETSAAVIESGANDLLPVKKVRGIGPTTSQNLSF